MPEPITTATALKLLGVNVGSAILGRLFGGDRPQRAQQVPDSLFNVTPELLQFTNNAISNQASNQRLQTDQAIENLRAAGATGSGLGAGLEGLFAQNNQSQVNLLANLARVRAQEINRQRAAVAANRAANFADDLAGRTSRAQGFTDILNNVGTVLGSNILGGSDPLIERDRAREDLAFFPGVGGVPAFSAPLDILGNFDSFLN